MFSNIHVISYGVKLLGGIKKSYYILIRRIKALCIEEVSVIQFFFHETGDFIRFGKVNACFTYVLMPPFYCGGVKIQDPP